MHDNKPYYFKWEIVLIFLSLAVSIANFLFTIYVNKQSLKLSSISNIQVIESYAHRGIINDTLLIIDGTITISNIGNSSTQITDIICELIETGQKKQKKNSWFAISDRFNPYRSKLKSFYQNRNNPFLSILNKTFLPDETKVLKFALSARGLFDRNYEISALKLTILFQNGERKTIIPEIKWYGYE
jgi:hypothetical protein